jgi:hypothetical protein
MPGGSCCPRSRGRGQLHAHSGVGNALVLGVAQAVGFWLWWGGGWGHAQGSGGPGGQPPVPAAEQADQGGHQQRPDHGGVQQDAGAKAGGEDLEGGLGPGGQGGERREQDQGGAGDQPSGAADALHDGGGGGAGGVVGLAHPGEDEHLVVHREPIEEREHHHRDEGVDGAGGGDAPQARAVAVLPHQHQHAVDGSDAEQVEQHRLGRQQQRAECAGQQQEGDRGDDAKHQREAAVDGAGEVDVQGAAAADLHPGDGGGGLPNPGDGLLARGGAGLGDRLDVDQGGAAATPGGVVGGDRGVDAGHPCQAGSDQMRRPGRSHEVRRRLRVRGGSGYLPSSTTLQPGGDVWVQRVWMPDSGAASWTVLGDDHGPVAPVERWLAYLTLVQRSRVLRLRRASARSPRSCGRPGRRLGAGRTSAPLGPGSAAMLAEA